ncbi:probable ATP-dependent RNA helicase DHX58 [Microcaecilia unicolor]|uniref:Probable ATP-dependent RNA helicase DHX58 n=1 Tax=Microcaecilia unicolor TaxID=1415580 RepID=A0A6P7ZM36_9AMPH|nr:probable ATP-dependent RNA helicase DHX58 [Microcaecilia unicolor]
MTNEISMVQARGRARAEDSVYSVLAKSGSKEVKRENTNESLEELMKRAIEEVQRMPEAEYRQKGMDLRTTEGVYHISESERGTTGMQEAEVSSRRSVLYCRNCNVAVCYGSDLRTIEKTHHVNINPDFKTYYKVSAPIPLAKKMEDWIPGGEISCRCGQKWGMEMIYKAVSLPNIAVKNFVVKTPEGTRTFKKWKDAPFPTEDFDYIECCYLQFPDLEVK